MISSNEFEKIQKQLSRISSIPLIEIQNKFTYSDPETIEKIENFIHNRLDTLRILKHKEITQKICSEKDENKIKEIINSSLSRYFSYRFRCNMERAEIHRKLVLLESKMPGTITRFIEDNSNATEVLSNISIEINKIFSFIARDNDILGNREIAQLYENFTKQKQDELAAIFKLNLKYNKKHRIAEIIDGNRFDQQLTDLMNQYILESKVG